nr:hypothetical protein CFP56_67575 [Quercus suber]
MLSQAGSGDVGICSIRPVGLRGLHEPSTLARIGSHYYADCSSSPLVERPRGQESPVSSLVKGILSTHENVG